MTLYLQMDGVDDKINIPSVPYTRVELDVLLLPITLSLGYVIDSGSRATQGYVRYSNTGAFAGTGTGTKLNERTIITMTPQTTPNTSGFGIFGSGTSYAKGNIYSIKVYNSTTLIASYDMTTGTVQDQSGNGYNATLTGGTWLDDGTGGTPTTINAVTADSTADTIAPVVATQQQVTISSIIADATADALSPSVGSFTNITINAVIVSATADSIGPSVDAVQNIGIDTLIADAAAEALVSMVGSSTSIQITTVTASLTTDAINPTIQTDAIISAFIADVIASGMAPGFNVKVIIGTIRLKGSQQLNVYLKGKQALNVNLKGVIQ